MAYLSREPVKFKQEFVHADSLFQGDLTGIMPLNEDSVQPSFAPYDKIASVPITRNDKEFQDKNIPVSYTHPTLPTKSIVDLSLLTDSIINIPYNLIASIHPTP